MYYTEKKGTGPLELPKIRLNGNEGGMKLNLNKKSYVKTIRT